MKRNHLRALLVMSALVLTVAVVFSPVLAGAPTCSNMASASCAAGCELCPFPNGGCGSCTGSCGNSGKCALDQTQWKGLHYDADGNLKKDLSARQAQKVARQFLAKIGMEDSKIKVVSDDSENFTVTVKQAGHNVEHKLAISKKTAHIRPQNA